MVAMALCALLETVEAKVIARVTAERIRKDLVVFITVRLIRCLVVISGDKSVLL